MNIVKGVADLLRRTSSSQSADFGPGLPSERFTPTSVEIRFSDIGDEAILNTQWERYKNTFDQAEKRNLLNIFLKHFLTVYRNWEPVNLGQSPNGAVNPLTTGRSQQFAPVIGCCAGHPAEIIHVLVEEMAQITSMLMEKSTSEQPRSSTSTITHEGLHVLDALAVTVRSMHNCRIFGFYGGVQKLTALMKAAVVQLKTISSSLSADESLPNSLAEKSGILQNILVYVVLILCNYIDLNSGLYAKTLFDSCSWDMFVPWRRKSSDEPLIKEQTASSKKVELWHQKAIVSVMEAGGLNWLVELLRVLRRLSMKEQWIDLSLQYLTLRTLRLSLAYNPRGQNHFRSIGGLEVLLDGLGIPPSNVWRVEHHSFGEMVRIENPLIAISRLHVLSLEVLKEAVLENSSNLQFLSENGRIQKFANSFCSLAFMLQEYVRQSNQYFPVKHENKKNMYVVVGEETESAPSISACIFDSETWNDYVVNLNKVLCSFLLPLEDSKLQKVQTSTRSNLLTLSTYMEHSVKWFRSVLLAIFPCIKACSNENELPTHLRVFVHILQHSVLSTFRKVLVSFPTLLDVFRAEEVWDFVFSENLFYSGPTSTEFSVTNCSNSGILVSKSEEFSKFTCIEGEDSIGIDILQVEAISLLEFAATLSGRSHNLPECSVLLGALEQSISNPEIAFVLAKSLLHVLQLSPEKSISSFKELNGLSKVLEVASILTQEARRPDSTASCSEPVSEGVSPCQSYDISNSLAVQNVHKSVEMTMKIFAQFFTSTDDAKSCILCNSACIDRIFDLFWEEALRKQMLCYVLELMMISPSDEEEVKAKGYLCSKYLETFTHVKEREENFVELSVDLLVGMRNLLSMDLMQYQTLFGNGECFLHIISLLNGNLDAVNGEKLVLNVLQTLTCLLSGNDDSKAAFRDLVGLGYQTLGSLFLDIFECCPSEAILHALLDMLVDGKFDLKVNPVIKNEDVICLYLRVLQKSSESLRNNGLNTFLLLLKDSISNRDSCVRAGMLNFLLDWFSQEDDGTVILKIAQLIQVTGGHSISGKDIRKIFALLRSEEVGVRQQCSSLLLTSMLSMLNEKGPMAFFDCSGIDSGIRIKTPVHWPLNRGFSFTCWLRVERFPKNGTMGLFSFLTEAGRGCFAVLAKRQLIYQSVNQKQQRVIMQVNLETRKWHFLCLTHATGRTFSGGSQIRCYVDGVLVTSEKCRYAKVNEVMNNCSIGAKINFLLREEENTTFCVKDSTSFFGQMGPIYLFNDVITSEQVHGVYSLGPSYMFSFLGYEVAASRDGPLPGGILDTKDGLASKIIFGLNAQASKGRTLFNVSPLLEHGLDDSSFEANVLIGTQLCSRRLLQQIIYCVGGVSVFFPLITQYDFYESKGIERVEKSFLGTFTKEGFTAEVIEIIACVLDENLANQQQMLLLSGFSILGFLLQSVPSEQLNMETLSALKDLFNVVANSGLSDVLVQDAVSHIFLNPHIWGYTVYKVQRELYMFLIQKLDSDPRLLENFCRLPRVLDIIRQFYWDNSKSRCMIGYNSSLHPLESQAVGDRPTKEEVHKIRLLLLGLGEMSLRQHISAEDVKALVAFFETSQDMACIEDVLHMVIRAVSEKTLLASFLEQVNLIGGSHIFINLLQRDFEPIRLLGFLFLGRLLVGLPSEKKGLKFFNIPVGKSKSLQGPKRMQPIFSLISDRLFGFPQTDNLSATLFDVLLGGASPKQVLQNKSQLDRQQSGKNNSQFFLPQMLALIFRYMSRCESATARVKIISDLLDLLDSNTSNVEALMEHGWNAWLIASVRLDVLKNYKIFSRTSDDVQPNEQMFIRSLYSSVLSHYVLSVKGGWQYLEETVNFLLIQCEHGGMSYQFFLRDIFEEILQKLIDLSAEENIFLQQTCRDNVLYLLKLVDEMLISEIDHKIPFPTTSSGFHPNFLDLENHKDIFSAIPESLQGELSENVSSPWLQKDDTTQNERKDEKWWHLYDIVWIIISEMNCKGTSKVFPGSSSTPTLGQRARGLVESLNIPAAELVSGGISNALVGKPHKTVDKAMLLRGERCPRIVFRLMVFYLCECSLERVSQFMQQIIPLLPCLLTVDDEQSKNRLHLLIWSLSVVRSQYGASDDGARFHAISHLIHETTYCCKSALATSIISKDETFDFGSNSKESSTIQNEQVITAVVEEIKYLKSAITDRASQIRKLHLRMDENATSDASLKKALEDEIQNNLNSILAYDEMRRAYFHLALDEEEQTIVEKWMHTIRTLIDERGPWSANPFPNKSMSHWKLDRTEDAWRRRQKLRRNYHFDEKLCHPPCASLKGEPFFSVVDDRSVSGSHIPEHMKRLLRKGIRKISDEGMSEMIEHDNQSNTQKTSTSEVDSHHPEIAKKSSDHKDILVDRKDYTYSSTESGNSEVLLSVPCVLVTPKRKLAGHLAVMKNIIHFFGEFLLEGTGGSAVFKVFDSSGNVDQKKFDQLVEFEKQKLIKLPISSNLESVSGSIMNYIEAVQTNVCKKQYKHIKRHRRWSMYKIKAVHWTRYLLRYTAIEIFFNDSVAPVFINFPSQKIAKDVGSLVVSTRNELMFPKGQKDRGGAISFVDRRVAFDMAETARESWKRRDITNFEYLMILNTLSGRSYNDLTQYPIFPWILADYSSETLDFNKSSTFRDLSKPVGALDSKRFEKFVETFQMSGSDSPSFYYGSHYSSMGIVLFYLLRLEPFTSLHRSLQGGKFDHADRLFSSIEGTYRNCLTITTDVKELIPEFYYMPEFLVNSNLYHFGVRQDGEPLGDVLLPPWAKGSPEGFISKNREALESEYVSSNLHHWIDLVFGYKQCGKHAVEAANVFYYLTYEGAVDLDTIDNEIQSSAIEDQIANFGQTPMQIFRKKHPRRGPPVPIAHPLQYAPGSIKLTSIVANTSNVPSTILYVHVFDFSMVLVNQGLTMSVKMWLTTQLGNLTFSGSLDPSFGIGSDILSPRKIGSPLGNLELRAQCFATLQTPSETFLISCGTWENSFQVISINDGRIVQSIRQHKDIVSCVAVTSDGSILATGSYDTTVMVWEVTRVRASEKRGRSSHAEFSRRDSIVAETPFHILCGHDDVITCLHVSVELDIVISGSKDGTCIFHSLREGRYVRSLQHPSCSPLTKLVVSSHGRIVLYADDDLSLHLYSINGKHIATCDSNGRLNCVELSKCGEFLICGGDQGQIVVRYMDSFGVVSKYATVGKTITSLTVTPEECIIAGTKEGSLLLYSIENSHIGKSSVHRNMKF